MLGGAFNPPHVGHLLLAQEARRQLGLERVLLMVTGQAPHKRIEPEPGPRVRLELTEAAAAGEPGVEASALELEREGPSYTYLTLELARLGVVPRPGLDSDAVRSELERLGAAERAEMIEMPLCGASSTEIRKRAAAGRPLRHLVPEAVERLIEERGLYR